jgi:hypothetical protein
VKLQVEATPEFRDAMREELEGWHRIAEDRRDDGTRAARLIVLGLMAVAVGLVTLAVVLQTTRRGANL